MQHPEVLFLPVLMLADYFLTVWSESLRVQKYAEHFRTEHFELNPVWQQDVSRIRWFNPRHLIKTVVLTALLAALVEFGELPPLLIQLMLGCLYVLFGMIIGRHLANLLIFRRLILRPGEIRGSVSMTHELVLALSAYQGIAVVIPLALVAYVSRNAFAVGGLAGVCLFFVVHWAWLRKYRKQASRNPEQRMHG